MNIPFELYTEIGKYLNVKEMMNLKNTCLSLENLDINSILYKKHSKSCISSRLYIHYVSEKFQMEKSNKLFKLASNEHIIINNNINYYMNGYDLYNLVIITLYHQIYHVYLFESAIDPNCSSPEEYYDDDDYAAYVLFNVDKFLTLSEIYHYNFGKFYGKRFTVINDMIKIL
jgi:hypothetical protein